MKWWHAFAFLFFILFCTAMIVLGSVAIILIGEAALEWFHSNG